MIQRFGFVAFAMIALGILLMGRAMALPPAPPASSADSLFAELDARAALSGLPSLRTSTLPSDDIEVRVWCGGPDSYRDSFAFKREGGVWSGLALLPMTPATQACHFEKTLSQSPKDWEVLHEQLEAVCQRTPTTLLPAIADGKPLLSHIGYVVEIREAGKYQTYVDGNMPPRYGDPDKPTATLWKLLEASFPVSAYLMDGIGPMSTDAEQHLLNDDFQTFENVQQIPSWVRSYLVGKDPSARLIMANPNEPWQSTDVITAEGLPLKRLVFVSVAGDYCVLAFQQGGFATYSGAVLFHRSPTGPFAVTVEGTAALRGEKTLHDLQQREREHHVFRTQIYSL